MLMPIYERYTMIVEISVLLLLITLIIYIHKLASQSTILDLPGLYSKQEYLIKMGDNAYAPAFKFRFSDLVNQDTETGIKHMSHDKRVLRVEVKGPKNGKKVVYTGFDRIMLNPSNTRDDLLNISDNQGKSCVQVFRHLPTGDILIQRSNSHAAYNHPERRYAIKMGSKAFSFNPETLTDEITETGIASYPQDGNRIIIQLEERGKTIYLYDGN